MKYFYCTLLTLTEAALLWQWLQTPCIRCIPVVFFGMVFFGALFAATLLFFERVRSVSPGGLCCAVLMAIGMQSMGGRLCAPCFTAHTAHILFWGALFYQRYGHPKIGVCACAMGLGLPLLFFGVQRPALSVAALPSTSRGYVICVVQPSCTVCGAQLPRFAAFAERVERRGIRCIIASDGGWGELQDKAPSIAVHKTSALFSERRSFAGYPIFFFATPRGEIVRMELGVSDLERELLDGVRALLGESRVHPHR